MVFACNGFLIKILLIDSLLIPIVESTYFYDMLLFVVW